MSDELRNRVGGETFRQVIDGLENWLPEAPVSVPFEKCECRQLPDGALLTCSNCTRRQSATRRAMRAEGEQPRRYCGNCGEWNAEYPDPCPSCYAEWTARSRAEAEQNASKREYCVLCGNESRTMVCSECSAPHSPGKGELSA